MQKSQPKVITQIETKAGRSAAWQKLWQRLIQQPKEVKRG
jgi:hypothetical protein